MPDSPDGIIKRSIRIAGHRTSVSIEQPFWEELRQIAGRRNLSMAQLIGEIDQERKGQNLSSAIRVHVLLATLGRVSGAALEA